MKKRDAFFKMTYGLYLISCADEDTRNAYIANTAFQVSSQPAKFAISCHKQNLSATLIEKGGAFCISVLQQDTPLEFIQRYGYQSGVGTSKFRHLNYKKGVTGVPVVYDFSIAWFECLVEQKVDVGTHWLFVGEMADYGLLSSTEEPLDYSWYRNHYKAASPAKAPTYVPEEDNGQSVVADSKHASYACAICEYIYHPSNGDAVKGVAPGTPFEELPDDWVCPVCGAGKTLFTETSAGY